MIFTRYWRFAALLFVSTGFLCAQDGYREFTDTQGRTIRARIYASDGSMVKLELEDGSAFETPITIFSPNDQTIIREWKPGVDLGSNVERIEISGVEVVDGYYHKIGDELGITGIAYENFSDDTPKAEIHLKYGLQHGLYTTWHETTGNKKFEAKYYQGKREGVSTFWYPSGKMKSQSGYKAGVQHGLTTFWYETGQIKSEGIWHAGNRFGLRTEWHENGQKKSEYNYVGGKPEGKGATWHPNGQQSMEVNWTNGLKTGFYREWHDNGQMSVEAEYDDQGILIGQMKKWDTEGEKIRESRTREVSDSPREKKPRKPFFSFLRKKRTTESTEEPEEPQTPKPPKPKKPRGPLLPPPGEEGYYVRLLGMVSVPSEAVWRGQHDVDMDTAFAYGAAWGRDLGSYRFEFEGSYANYSISTLAFRSPAGPVYDLPASGDVDIFSLQFNNYFELEFTPNFEMYGGLGLGLAMRSTEGFTWNGKTYADEIESGFGWQIMTGMKYTIFDRHALLGGYRFQSLGDLSDFEDFGSHNFEFGYRLNL